MCLVNINVLNLPLIAFACWIGTYPRDQQASARHFTQSERFNNINLTSVVRFNTERHTSDAAISPQAEFEAGVYASSVVMAGRYFLYHTADRKSLVVWDMERQQPLGQLEGHDGDVELVAARGDIAVTCQIRGPVRARVWNLETMECTATLLQGPDDADTSSACCMDGGKVLLGQEDGIIKV